jgi:hypothetical protein
MNEELKRKILQERINAILSKASKVNLKDLEY